MLDPGLHAFWNEPKSVEIEVFDLKEPELRHPRLEVIAQKVAAQRHLLFVRAKPHECRLLFRDGAFYRELTDGLLAVWRESGQFEAVALDMREQVLDISGQEIMTADKVTLRVNLVVVFKVANARRAVTACDDYKAALYREAQLALRGAVGTRPLDVLLTEKEAVGAELVEALAGRSAELGLNIQTAGVRDIVLPGEMKSILNKVIEAEKNAQANLIRRREETA